MSIIEDRRRIAKEKRKEIDSKSLRAYQMVCAGYTLEEVAEALDINKATCQFMIGHGKRMLTL